jgi:hypothetical protein
VSNNHGNRLPSELIDRLSQHDLGRHLGKGIPLVTVDASGRPHPMLLSALEIRALDAGSLAIVIGAGSRSARNLVERETGTLVLVEPEMSYYVKAKMLDGPIDVEGQPGLALFLLAVEEVLEDTASGVEAGMRVTTGIRYGPPPSGEEPWARAIRAALATPRFRA